MINSLKHLSFAIKRRTSVEELTTICDELTAPEHVYDAKHYRKKVDIKPPKKPGGKPKERILYPSKGRLKELQKGIKEHILSNIPLPAFIQGGVKGRSNITNALSHKGKRYKFTTDLKKFFPSVTSAMVYDMFVANGFSADVARTLTILCTYKGMLPQGTPTSTHVANLVFLPVDLAIQGCCSEPKVYTRFVDDITISSAFNLKPYTPIFVKTITDANFRISHQKTHFNGVADITGIKVSTNHIAPDNKFMDKLNAPHQSERQLVGRLNYLNRITEADGQ